MKKLLLLFVIFLSIAAHSQTYTWMHGSTASGQGGLYGTLGVSSSTNDPGTRHGAARWTDASGNLWLFGGEGNDAGNNYGWLNDLWKYTVSTNEWTWMGGSINRNATGVYGTQGVAAASNFPGAREFSVTWVDASGKFWLFGGDGYAATPAFGRLGDLWKYDPLTNQWTWMQGYNTINQNGNYGTQGTAGAAFKPGARYGGATWTDTQGKLWLFGGKGFDATGASNYLNDLWRYDPAINQWAWINGGTTVNQFGNYGTLSTPALTNQPGSREFPAAWITAAGELYIFGGWGYTSNASGYLNDLWKYNPTANNWTWVHGGSSFNQTGTYGTIGVESGLNVPGARLSPAAWKDDAGNFWLFGGDGFSSAGSGELNDLFKYNPCSNQWAWMKGSNIADQNAVYGSMTTPNSANTPGGRQYNNYWKGPGNTFWLFGAFGFGVTAPSGNMNDLWKFEPPCFHSTITTSNNSLCSGRTLSLSLGSVCEGTVSWYSSPTATNTIGSGNNFTTTLLAAASQSMYTIYAEAYSCTVSPRGAVTITVNTTPTVVVTPSVLCAGVPATLSISGATSYTWNGSTNTNSMAVYPIAPSFDFTLQGASANGCTSDVINTVAVSALPVVTISATNPLALCLNSAVTLTASGANSYTWDSGVTTPVITVTPTSLGTSYTITGTNSVGCINTAVVQQPVVTPPSLTVTPALLFCSEKNNTLTASGAVSYTWNGTTPTATLPVNPVSPVFNFTLHGVDANGCSSDSVGMLTVLASPTISVSTSHPLYLCRYQTSTLTASGSAATYSWSTNESTTTTTVAPRSTTVYTAIATAANGCQNTASFTQSVAICEGIKINTSDNTSVVVYPNPNSGEFIVRLENDAAQLIIYTTLGQQIAEETLKQGNNPIRSGLAKGLYYYQVQAAGKTLSTGRLLVE